MVAVVALQLVACGNTRGVGDQPEPRLSARPERSTDGAENYASTTPSPSTRIGDGRASRQRAGAAVRSDAHPADAEPTLDNEPVVTTDPGWEVARCAGAATRRVRMAGNLDSESFVLWSFVPPGSANSPWLVVPFSAEDPANTASFSTTFTGVDDQGRSQSVSVYFGRLVEGWEYHALMDGTAFVIGEGHLSFDDQGVVTVEVSKELRLLTASGPGHAVQLDLSGMTQLAEASNMSAQEVDGSEARWGSACAISQALPAEAAVTGPHCAAAATRRLALRANLAAASPVENEEWDPLAPTAGLTLPLGANDADGTLIDFELALRKTSAATWDYHVSLSGDEPGPEVASGSLVFNPNGSLRSVTTARPLHFPNHDGVLGDPIELDFGAGTAAGGSGVDGVTSLPGGSFEVWQQRDGAVLDCLPRAAATTLTVAHPPSCAGERTTAVSMSFNLDPATALSDLAAYSANVTVYDAALTPQNLELHFQHLEARHWRCQVVAASAEVGVVDLHFAANGAPELIQNIPVLRLPLADGSAGPPIQLAFDDGWAITSFSAESNGWLSPNGAAPHAYGCVE